MEKALYKSGFIAIPLKKHTNLNPSPDWFVIDYQQGNFKVDFKRLDNNLVEKTNCCEINYRIVFREVLEATSEKPKEFCERALLNSETLLIPIYMLPVLCNHQSIKENITIVNEALSRFSFRGVLSNLVLEVDEEVLDEIIAQENEPQ